MFFTPTLSISMVRGLLWFWTSVRSVTVVIVVGDLSEGMAFILQARLGVNKKFSGQVYLKRSATARAWSGSPSLSARVITVSLRLARAPRDRYWKVGLLMKSSSDKPENMRAHPPVGRTWLVPEA